MNTQSTAHELLTWFLNPPSKILEQEGPWRTQSVAKALAILHQHIETSRPSSEKQISIPAIKHSEYRDAYLRPVLELQQYAQENLRNFLTDFLIHGSIATLDYCEGWSNLDTYVIVDRSTCTDYEQLCELRQHLLYAHRFLLDIDPLAHHGFIICTEPDLENYPSTYLPIAVLNKAKSLLQENVLEIREIDCRNSLRERLRAKQAVYETAVEVGEFRHHKYNGEYLRTGFSNSSNAMYQLKYFLETTMILPAYYLEASGEPCYKKESFRIKDQFGSAWKIIDRASRIRDEWPKHEQHPYSGNAVPEWVMEILGEDYFEQGLDLVAAMNNDIEKRCQRI